MPKSKTYEEFVEKFRPKHTTDDCFTPENVYAVVRDWAVKKYHVTGEIVRPFWPGKDYTKAEYPVGCCVIDNPPFSIVSKIVGWYNAHGVRFFLFCPGLTSLKHARDGKTTFVSCGNTITFANGAKVCVAFLTNMGGDVLCETASDLHDLLETANEENEKSKNRKVTKLKLPSEIVTAARIANLSKNHIPFSIRRKGTLFSSSLDNYDKDIFGGLFLLSPSAAEKLAAAERAAAERAAALVITLSERENNIIKQLKG